MVGPTIQDDITTHLLRFRFHIVALKADLAKFFRQIRIHPEHADFQRIVWRDSPVQPIQEYRLLTVTYGTAASPFLAARTLKQLSIDEARNYPSASKVLAADFYVDDLISGSSSTANAIQLQHQLIELTQRGGFQLRKWSSNDPIVLASIPEELRETQLPLDMDSNNSVKALGIQWNPTPDTFIFSVQDSPHKTNITKRIVLSELAKVFDPLGWLSPTTIMAKVMFQSLWKITVNWDDKLPVEFQQQWKSYQEELQHIRLINIPRCLIRSTTMQHQIHGFCDASETAYAAVVYLRCQNSDGSISTNIIAAKSKVAPIKQVSLPRLELCGAHLLSKLLNFISTAKKIDGQVFAWSDSTVVLRWLSTFPGRWKTFVANRVAEIQETIPIESWHHVSSEENPADCASRGISASALKAHSLWWHGPTWLKSASFPSFPHQLDQKLVEAEEKRKLQFVSHICIDSSLLTKYSTLNKLKRVTAYCFRFAHNARCKSATKTGPLSCQELQSALHYWIKNLQSTTFAPEIQALVSNETLPAKTKLRELYPLVGQDGLLRVGGRLQKSNLPEHTKYQIILPNNSNLTKLIISSLHHLHMHAGLQLLWSILRKDYWVLKARSTIRSVIGKCVICRRYRAEMAQQLMGSLPSARVVPGRPFLNSGVDYAGPFNIRLMKGRNNKTFKAYIAIFVCLATKAVHIEAVSELSTDAFLATLKRFTSRRGLPSNVYRDCGTNFVGANSELQQFLESESLNNAVTSQLADKGISWHFNSPNAPHQGGLWEAGVKSTKYHLRRVIGNTLLTFEEFSTVLCQIEACLNSRPLCTISSDPTDLNVLTPGHFLIGDQLTAVPEEDVTNIKLNRLSRWQLCQQQIQHFWKRWSSEYLVNL